MTISYWNWSWVAAREDTKDQSNSINESGGSLYSLRAATRGTLSSRELNASINSLSSNISSQWRLWNNTVKPILDSLPAGDRDERWRTGKGLPAKIDSLSYGIQGTTLFVFNDADSIKASGRYWHTEDERPITIAESLENLWTAIDNIDIVQQTEQEDVDLSALWASIGLKYYNPSLSSSSSSLDGRTSLLESYFSQLRNDIYGVSTGYTPWTLGVPLSYSLAENIDYILKLHGVSGGWQSDPSLIDHSSVSAGEHVHEYSDIQPMPSSSLTQARTGPYDTLDNDIKRIRWEIQRTRGSSSWYADAVDPVTSGAGDLQTHMGYNGSGSVSSSNPHGLNYIDTGASVIFSNLARFTGMSSYSSGTEYPTYSSTNYVSSGTNLEVAISTLDGAIANAISGFLIKREYGPYDRSGLSDTEREQTAITIVHSKNQIPIVNVIDLSPDLQESWGMYSSPTSDFTVDYPDDNTIRIWTNAEVVKVICLFDGSSSITVPSGYSHTLLTDKDVDDHTQYLLASGLRAMAGNLNLAGYQLRTTINSLKFNDSYNAASSWSQGYINLAADSAEWTTFKTNFGEVSLMNAISQAADSGGGGVTGLIEDQILIGKADGTIDQSSDFVFTDDIQFTCAKNSTIDKNYTSVFGNYATTPFPGANFTSYTRRGADSGSIMVADNLILTAETTGNTSAYLYLIEGVSTPPIIIPENRIIWFTMKVLSTSVDSSYGFKTTERGFAVWNSSYSVYSGGTTIQHIGGGLNFDVALSMVNNSDSTFTPTIEITNASGSPVLRHVAYITDIIISQTTLDFNS